jgi:hypothetical protein
VQDETDVLLSVARQHRVDVAKVRKAVEAEFASKAAKVAAKQKQPGRKPTAKVSEAA